MAATKPQPKAPRPKAPQPAPRPSRRTVALAFGVAIAATVALVAVAVVFRKDRSTPPPTAAPVANLAGIPQSGSTLGSPDAKVTLIEYADPQCPACRFYAETMFPTVVDDYVRPGKVKAEFRGYPFIGYDSVKAYRFMLAAGEQNKLWNLTEALYRNQGAERSGWVTDELVRRLAGEIPGLNVDRLFADAQRKDIVDAASSASAQASAAGVTGTPTFLVKIGDAPPYEVRFASVEQLTAALDDALSS